VVKIPTTSKKIEFSSSSEKQEKVDEKQSSHIIINSTIMDWVLKDGGRSFSEGTSFKIHDEVP
jgi:hypothetical protein